MLRIRRSRACVNHHTLLIGVQLKQVLKMYNFTILYCRFMLTHNFRKRSLLCCKWRSPSFSYQFSSCKKQNIVSRDWIRIFSYQISQCKSGPRQVVHAQTQFIEPHQNHKTEKNWQWQQLKWYNLVVRIFKGSIRIKIIQTFVRFIGNKW